MFPNLKKIRLESVILFIMDIFGIFFRDEAQKWGTFVRSENYVWRTVLEIEFFKIADRYLGKYSNTMKLKLGKEK